MERLRLQQDQGAQRFPGQGWIVEKKAIWGPTAQRAGAEESICNSSEGSEEQSIALGC